VSKRDTARADPVDWVFPDLLVEPVYSRLFSTRGRGRCIYVHREMDGFTAEVEVEIEVEVPVVEILSTLFIHISYCRSPTPEDSQKKLSQRLSTMAKASHFTPHSQSFG
jgi:hypothetical protein